MMKSWVEQLKEDYIKSDYSFLVIEKKVNELIKQMDRGDLKYSTGTTMINQISKMMISILRKEGEWKNER